MMKRPGLNQIFLCNPLHFPGGVQFFNFRTSAPAGEGTVQLGVLGPGGGGYCGRDVCLLYFHHSPGLPARFSPSWSREQVKAQLQVLGPLSMKDWAAITGIVLFVLGLATSSIHKADTPWVGMAVLFLFLALGIFGGEEFQRDINWPFLIYLGGLISLMNTMSYVGLDQWLGSHLFWMTDYMNGNFPLFVLLLCLGVVLVQLLIPYGTTVAVFATVFIPVAQASGINPWLTGFIIIFMADGWFFPYQSGTYLFFRELANKRSLFNERSLLAFNALTVAVRLAAVFTSIPYWKLLGLV